jgi:hypothetical protein
MVVFKAKYSWLVTYRSLSGRVDTARRQHDRAPTIGIDCTALRTVAVTLSWLLLNMVRKPKWSAGTCLLTPLSLCNLALRF